MKTRTLGAYLIVLAMLATLLGVASPGGAQQSQTFTGWASANGPDWLVHTFEASSPAQIEAVLDWDNTQADLNLFLRNPGGDIVAMSTTTTSKPESLAHEGRWAGTWAVAVKARTGGANYTLTVNPNAVAQQHVFTGTEAAGGGWQAHAFDVAEPTDLTATLSWGGGADLNLFLVNPAGDIVAASTSRTANPESLQYIARTTGKWVVAANAASGSAQYTLTVAMGAGETSPPPASSPPPPAPPPPTSGGGAVQSFAIEQENPSHNHTLSQAVSYAQQHDLITALRFALNDHVDAMVAANPDLVLAVYLNGVFAQGHEQTRFPEHWYLRDSQGRKIQNDWGLWMLDVGLPAVQNQRADECKEFIRQSGYHGCFLDNLGWGTLWPPSLSGQPINPRTGREYTNAEWLQGTSTIVRLTKNLVGPGHPVIANGLVSGQAYFDSAAPTRSLTAEADLSLAETFIRTARMGVNQSRPEAQWKQDVDMLVHAAAAGRRVMVSTKVWRSDATAADVNRWHQFALASFMLGDNGTHYFYFSGAEHATTMTSHPWWDTDLGSPQGAYVRNADGIYQRNFAAGRVLANPTGTGRQVALGGSFRNLHGQWVSTVWLPPTSGAILSTR